METALAGRVTNTALEDAVRVAARAGSPDRYLAALLSPRAVRDDLIVLAALGAEIEKIPQQVSDPHIGEIRIQWWRDALLSPDRRVKSGHAIADAVLETLERHELPAEWINGHLDATVHELYAAPPDNEEQLALQLEMKEGALFRLAAKILGANHTDISGAIFSDAALAYGLARLGLSLPYDLARGRVPFPPALTADPPDWKVTILGLANKSRLHLRQVRAACSTQPTAVKAALLPVALVEPYLRVLTRVAHDPARDIADIAPLTRAWRLAKTHISGRI